MEKEKSKILIFGGTGYIGKYMVKASLKMGHPTLVYSRPLNPQSSGPTKTHLLNEFQSMGVTIVHGDLNEIEEIVAVLRQVDIVISTLAVPQVLDQLKIIDAIKIAGNIKRFFPSEFGCEEDRTTPLPPFEGLLEKKRKIRRAIEAAGIPYTFVSSNCCASYFINYLLHPHDKTRTDLLVYGPGMIEAVLNSEEDIATYTIKAADDPRTLNRIVIYRPPNNIISQLELISLWEKKTGRSFKRVHVPEDEIVKLSESLPHPQNIPWAILHSVFVKGDLMNYELGNDDMEASRLYQDIEYTSVDQLLDLFLVNPPKPAAVVFA